MAFQLNLRIPTRDEIEKKRANNAVNLSSDAFDETVKNMFSNRASATPAKDYMSGVASTKKMGRYAPDMQKMYDANVDQINNLQTMTKKLNTIPYSNITNELNVLTERLRNGSITGSAFNVAVTNLYKRIYDTDTGVLTNENVLKLGALDTSLNEDIKNYKSYSGQDSKSPITVRPEDGVLGVVQDSMTTGGQTIKDYITASTFGDDAFSNVQVDSVVSRRQAAGGEKKKLAVIQRDLDINMENVFKPIQQELIHIAVLGLLQKQNPESVGIYKDDVASTGVQGDNIMDGLERKIMSIIKTDFDLSGKELDELQLNQITTDIMKIITDKAEGLVEDYGTNAANFADSALKSENLLNNIFNNLETQFTTNIAADPTITQAFTVMKNQLGLEELIDNSKLDDETKTAMKGELNNILYGSFIDRGALGNDPTLILGKGLVVLTKFIEDLSAQGVRVNPLELAKKLELTSGNKDLFLRAFKRLQTIRKDVYSVLDDNPELKARVNGHYDSFSAAARINKLSINIEKLLSGQEAAIPDEETITVKQKEAIEDVISSIQDTTTQTDSATPDTDIEDKLNDLGYSVNDDEINDFKSAAVSTIMKYNMLDDLQLLNKFIARYTLEIDENMSVEQQEKFKDMVLNTINTSSEATV
tara:strand:+ start:2253 stop:4190 length:1938 start_codon:yes stop_codon:yes gene_type:complete